MEQRIRHFILELHSMSVIIIDNIQMGIILTYYFYAVVIHIMKFTLHRQQPGPWHWFVHQKIDIKSHDKQHHKTHIFTGITADFRSNLIGQIESNPAAVNCNVGIETLTVASVDLIFTLLYYKWKVKLNMKFICLLGVIWAVDWRQVGI